MILTRSPYYIDIEWTQNEFTTIPERYEVELFIWKGLKEQPPFTPTYKIENKNPLNRVGLSSVNISNYINDLLGTELNQSNVTDVLDSDSAVWVKSQVIYYIDGVAQEPYYISIDLAIKGYGYTLEGVNPTIPTNNILTVLNCVNVSKKSNYVVPILASETEIINIKVVSYPSNQINESFDISFTTDSTRLIKNIFINCSQVTTDKSILISKNNEPFKELILKDEFRYNPVDIFFVNKYGQLDTLVFFKDKVETLKVTNQEYQSNTGQSINGNHQFQKYNTNGKTEYKINSGWVKESNNEIFKQLFLSDKVWELKDGVFIPLNLGSTNFEYKTKQRDKLINYEVSFKYSFNDINTL